MCRQRKVEKENTMDMNELRSRIDEIDAEMVELYKKRLGIVEQIGAYKRENGLPVYDGERERKLLDKAGAQAGEKYEGGVRAMFRLLMDESRTRQLMDNGSKSVLKEMIDHAVQNTDPLFPSEAAVACLGVEDTYSRTACERLFRASSIMYCKTMESVFDAIESGLCRYGILPVGSSTEGFVNRVYDLMIRHHFYIVRSVRVRTGCTPCCGSSFTADDVPMNSNDGIRFICISKNLEIYPGVDRTGMALVLADRPGSLWQLLSRFYARNINLTKLESRSIPGRDEWMCCIEIDTPVSSPSFTGLIEELDVTMESFSYLGSYMELV